MANLKSISGCILWNFRMLLRDFRLYLGFLLGFLICCLLSEKVLGLSRTYGTQIHVFEPFIWCFASGDHVLFSSLALFLPLSQLPRMDASASFLLFRAGRSQWLLGQLLTVLLLSLAYSVFLVLSTCLLTLGHGSLTNNWSDTATILSFAPGDYDVALTVVRKTVKLSDPLTCACMIFLLTALYMSLVSALTLLFSLTQGRRAGITAAFLLSFCCYLLTPDRFLAWLDLPEQLAYVANLAAAWVSPLSHATYTMHSFGFDDLPSLAQSTMLLSTATLMLLIISFAAARRMPIHFHKGDSYERR